MVWKGIETFRKRRKGLIIKEEELMGVETLAFQGKTLNYSRKAFHYSIFQEGRRFEEEVLIGGRYKAEDRKLIL